MASALSALASMGYTHRSGRIPTPPPVEPPSFMATARTFGHHPEVVVLRWGEPYGDEVRFTCIRHDTGHRYQIDAFGPTAFEQIEAELLKGAF